MLFEKIDVIVFHFEIRRKARGRIIDRHDIRVKTHAHAYARARMFTFVDAGSNIARYTRISSFLQTNKRTKAKHKNRTPPGQQYGEKPPNTFSATAPPPYPQQAFSGMKKLPDPLTAPVPPPPTPNRPAVDQANSSVKNRPIPSRQHPHPHPPTPQIPTRPTVWLKKTPNSLSASAPLHSPHQANSMVKTHSTPSPHQLPHPPLRLLPQRHTYTTATPCRVLMFFGHMILRHIKKT